MGDPTKESKKPQKESAEIQMPPDYIGKDAGKQTQATETAPGTAVDFAELDAAYENLATQHRGVINRQQIGVRQVLGNLNEADSPSISDDIIKTLAVSALGFGTAGVSTYLAGKLTSAAATTLNSAIQTALDDGLKEAIGSTVTRLSAGGATSKATFFAAQEEALETSREAGENAITNQKLEAKKAISSTEPDSRAAKLAEKLLAARDTAKARDHVKETARAIQYRESLSAWMTAMARDELGTSSGGTQLKDAMDISPKHHFSKTGETGVIYVAFGMKSAARPITASNIKVSGMTSAARDQIKDVPLRDLKMPIIATGYLYDGFADSLSISMLGDNEISLGRTETGAVSVWGHEDARNALKKAANTTSEVVAAQTILEEDIGSATLAKANV